MVTKEIEQVRCLQRYDEDTQNLQPGMVVTTTIQKQYTIDDLRRIIETPSHVLTHYKLAFINNQIIVTVEVMIAETQVYEEAIA